ncbi:hypothetical protein PoB_005052100 [Plakobranchus ocellatus]|uniref:Uncharacterized protein n=1 Tax=Plakobranchus ocellatus TaxID=259542 RepID=A0AAV4BY33_9GAST|nr:hypothetical protein PoB_005052100 [Plakobranchus ocellatus]
MIQFKQGGGLGAVTLANLIGLMAVGSPLRLISLTFPDSPRISHSYYSGTRKSGAICCVVGFNPRKAKASAMSSSLNPPENERVSAGSKADWQTSVPRTLRDRNDKGKNFAATRPIWLALNPLQSDISKAGLPKLDNV